MRYNLPNGIRIYLCVSSRLERTPTIKLTVTLPRFHHESPIYLLYCRHHTNLFILTLQFPRFQLFSDPNLGPTDRDWHALFYCWNELFIVWINNKCSFTVQLLNRSLQAHFHLQRSTVCHLHVSCYNSLIPWMELLWTFWVMRRPGACWALIGCFCPMGNQSVHENTRNPGH